MLQAVLGVAVLGTIFAPWFIVDRPPAVGGLFRSSSAGLVMSWDILSETSGGIGAFLIVSWIVALASVVVGLGVRGLPRAVTNATLGLMGLLFFLIVGVDALSPRGSADLAPCVLVTLSLVLLPALLVSGHCRVRIGQSLPMRVLLCGLGGALAVLGVGLLILSLIHFFEMDSAARWGFMLDLPWLVVGLVVLVGGCVLVAVDGATGKVPPGRGRGGLILIYLGLVVLGLYLVVRPNLAALSAGTRSYTLMPLYWVLMLVLFGVLLCGGALQVVCRAIEVLSDPRRFRRAGSPAT